MKQFQVIFLFLLLTHLYSQCPNLSYSFDKPAYCIGDTMNLWVGGTNFDSISVDLNPVAIDTLQGAPAVGVVSTAGETGSRALEIIRNFDGNYYLIAGYNTSLTLYNVGPDLLNPSLISSQSYAFSSIGLSGLYLQTLRILKDKGRYVLFVGGRYGSTAKISVLDFGNSLANTPTINTLTTCAFFGIEPLYFKGKYHIFVACAPHLTVLTLDSLKDTSPSSFTINNLLAAPTASYFGALTLRKNCDTVEIFFFEQNSHDIKKVTFYGAITNTTYQTTLFPNTTPSPYIPLRMRLVKNFQDKIFFTGLGDPKVVLGTIDTASSTTEYQVFYQSPSHSLFGFSIQKIQGEYYLYYPVAGDSIYYVKFPRPTPVKYNVLSSSTLLNDSLPRKEVRWIEFQICQDTMGCATFYDSIEVGRELSAEISQLIAPCEGQPVVLTYNTSNELLIDSLYWDMGDGTLLPQTDTVSYIYPVAQDYTVTLSLIDTLGCYHTIDTPITINKIPTADFSPTLPQCAFQPVSFSNLSSVTPPDSLILFKWDFGDGTASTLKNPTHKYSQGGNYNVTLIAYTSNLCPDTVVKTISVPGIKITRDSACVNQPINLSYQLFYPTGNPSATWEIDGQTYTGNPLQHTFPSTGVHSVKVIVTTTTGCQDTLELPITITNPPPINVQIKSSGCVGDALKTFYTGVPVEAPLQSILWDFDPTASADNQIGNTATYAYTTPGLHSLKIIVTDTYGCANDSTLTIKVTEKPQASFSLPPTLCQKPLKLSQQSTSNDTLFFIWKFPDSTLSYLDSPTWMPDTGTQNIQLIVRTSSGCADTTSQTVKVFPTPNASFYTLPQDSGHIPLSVILKNTTDTTDTSINFHWLINNHFLTNTYDTSVFIDSSQTILFSLIATNSYGCADTAEKTFLALPPIPEYIDLEILKILLSNDSLNQAQIQLLLRNNGNTLLTHWQNKLSFSDFASFSFLLQDSLKPQETRLLTLPISWNEQRLLSNKYICIETYLPNGKKDQVPENNSQCLQLSKENSFLGIFPNPASNNFFLHISLFAPTQIKLQILSALGQPLQEHILSLAEGIYKLPIDISQLPKGFYLVKIELNEKTYYEKLLTE